MMRVTHSKFFVFVLLSAAAGAIGQGFEKTTLPNITSERILSVARDSLGYMWLGTDEGLNRFDGVRITNYRSNVFDTTTISSNRVWDIFVDNENNVWVLNDRGVDLYNRTNNDFVRFKTGSRPLHLSDNGDSLIVTTRQSGLLVIDKKTMTTSLFSFDPLDPMSISSSRFSDAQTSPVSIKKNMAWVGTANGLNRVNFSTKSAKRLYKEKSELVQRDTILAVLELESELLIGSSAGVVAHNETSGKTTRVINHHTNAIVKTHQDGTVMALGQRKSILLDNDKNILNTIKHTTPKTEVLYLGGNQYILWSKKDVEIIMVEQENDHWLWDKGSAPAIPEEILFDPEGNIWIASKDGLFVGSNTEAPTSFVKHNNQKSKSLFTKTVNNHLIYIDGAVFETRKSSINKVYQIDDPPIKDNLSGMFVTPDGETYLFGKKIYHVSNGKAQELAAFDGDINAISVNKNYLLASIKNSGIVAVGLSSREIYDYRENRLIMKDFPIGASSIYIDSTSAWIGSEESGLYEYDMSRLEKPKLIQHYVYNSDDPQSFASSSVSCLQPQNGQMFIGTNGDGIFQHLGSEKFDKITFEDGLPSNNIISLAPSSDSLLWALTKEGASLINHINGEVKNLSMEEGLETFIESQNSLVSTQNGNAMIAGLGGHYYIDKDLIYINEYEEFVSIESVSLIDKNNKKYPTKKENIKATYTTPTINISFTSPSYYRPTETTFSFLVDGHHDSWVDNGLRRNIELQGFSPGKYTAQIKSYNSDGYESRNIASVDFQVVPPWWKTWWAYVLYVATVFAVFTYYVKYQKEAQAKASQEQRREEELEEARQFQLDMLPKETPDDLGLDISAAIQTASEVGGDYYDYFPQEDKKSLYVVVGDATGHGMTAGMMVSITKAGLYGIPPSIAPNDIAKRLNHVIKNIDLGWNRMAFNVARFWEDRVEFTSAAMPPVYHYREDTGNVDEILIEGLPLGSFKDETFSLVDFEFKQGDSLIFISDGLPEATNQTEHMLGYQAVQDCVQANGHQNANDQKQALLDLGSAWLGDLRNQDDITIVVVKKK
jgi:serine phosphatase RsbU (regulator of sigma subunit)